ncbi:MAG: hypothetical protein SGI92_00035 [Bryobacteraceae bacterium]|nr:hypothetical protein [Bryobacteraceae bacterium]
MFPSTRQTLLRDATAGTPFALDAVAGMYWQPCFRYLIARWRLPRDQAEDLVQGFFAALVEQELLARYDSSRGPFRPWLRACLDGFFRKDNERVAAAKRGGGAVSVPIDSSPDLASPGLTPEQIFHREWQREMFAQAAAELQTQCEADGRPERRLRPGGGRAPELRRSGPGARPACDGGDQPSGLGSAGDAKAPRGTCGSADWN